MGRVNGNGMVNDAVALVAAVDRESAAVMELRAQLVVNEYELNSGSR